MLIIYHKYHKATAFTRSYNIWASLAFRGELFGGKGKWVLSLIIMEYCKDNHYIYSCITFDVTDIK
jgi:hypothetical protein